MIYLLDTNAWISYLNQKNAPIVTKFTQIQDTQIVFCSIVKAELLFGAYKSTRRTQNISTLQRLFQRFTSYTFNFTLVTNNTREFQRIPNLKIEDWNKS